MRGANFEIRAHSLLAETPLRLPPEQNPFVIIQGRSGFAVLVFAIGIARVLGWLAFSTISNFGTQVRKLECRPIMLVLEGVAVSVCRAARTVATRATVILSGSTGRFRE